MWTRPTRTTLRCFATLTLTLTPTPTLTLTANPDSNPTSTPNPTPNQVLRNQTVSADVMARTALRVAGVLASPCGGGGDPCSNGGEGGMATTTPAQVLATGGG